MTERLVVISPHLDDAVLGCGQLIAANPGALVITVFAGTPQNASMLTEWDAACGFENAHEAMVARRGEDSAALALLEAEPYWLDCLDSQYRRENDIPDVAALLSRALPDKSIVAIPLGLFHSDHNLAHLAALDVFMRDCRRKWLAYEEPMYRRIPGLVANRLDELAQGRIRMQTLQTEARYRVEKKSALECYRSQLRGLASAGRPGHADAFAPERYWSLSR
jgi:LmbE family N-acetylglucosaminyl deacetylase